MTQLQQELHNEYREQLKLAWKSEDMVDYCTKTAEMVVKTEDGYYLEVEKQQIQKRFCFGYGYCGVCDDEDYDRASRMAQHARTKEDYFIKENLKFYDEWIDSIEKNGVYISVEGKYYSQTEDCKLRNYTCASSDWWNVKYSNDPKWKKLSPTDTQKLLIAFKECRENMIKRLKTYLKKYGLSKLHVWTYLSD